MSKNLKIIPLGGLGEIGKNMTILEYGRNQIIIDCGVMFPENDMYGIDLVLPQFDYVVENQDILRGIVLTHGHMDHIGGLPYLLKRIKAPIYGTALALGLVKRQLEEAGIYGTELNIITEEDKIHLGPFRVSPFPVAHSIPEAMGLVIDSPVGAVVFTGDYKLDETPAGGRTTDLKRLKKLTPNGVLALLGDSTGADKPGRTQTEQVVTKTLDELFANAQGQRIIIATFSSLLARLQAIMDLAQKHGRKIALTGRSLVENVALARELGYMRLPDKLLVDVNDKTPDGELIILSTGSQGEPRSALNRMATGQHRQVHVHQGDLIIISGGTIPGNEEDVGRMLNKLFERGAEVIYGDLAPIHVSGHGSRDEIQQMIETVQPRFLIPAHGESRHLHLHAGLGKAAGMNPDNIFVLRNGLVWASDGKQPGWKRPYRPMKCW
jgi:ribonuclease J